MSTTLDNPRVVFGHNSGALPPAPASAPIELTIAERLDPDILTDQLAIDFAGDLLKRDSRMAGFMRFCLAYSTLPRHAHDALPAAANPYDVIIVETGDKREAWQFDGKTFQPLAKAAFITRIPSTVVIPDAEIGAKATSFVKDLKENIAAIEANRVREKTPYDIASKTVQAFFKAGILDWLDAAAKAIEKGPLTVYLNKVAAEEAARRKAEALRLQEEADAALAAAARTQHVDMIDTAVQAGDLAEKAAAKAAAPIADMARTRGSMGGVSASITTWKYRITDRAKVPAEYWVLNDAKLAADVKRLKGTVEIPGIEQFSEQTASVRG